MNYEKIQLKRIKFCITQSINIKFELDIYILPNTNDIRADNQRISNISRVFNASLFIIMYLFYYLILIYLYVNLYSDVFVCVTD